MFNVNTSADYSKWPGLVDALDGLKTKRVHVELDDANSKPPLPSSSPPPPSAVDALKPIAESANLDFQKFRSHVRIRPNLTVPASKPSQLPTVDVVQPSDSERAFRAIMEERISGKVFPSELSATSREKRVCVVTAVVRPNVRREEIGGGASKVRA